MRLGTCGIGGNCRWVSRAGFEAHACERACKLLEIRQAGATNHLASVCRGKRTMRAATSTVLAVLIAALFSALFVSG
ncbi:MAG TPA: hypothetical protein VKA36_09660, partial [Solirubrobacterales bacterium]|nr:hypothetical protein [Solirubrobacterales bacterium]